MNLKLIVRAARIVFAACLLMLFVPEVKGQKKGGDEIFTATEQPAEFPGGMQAFGKFLAANIRYPKKEREENIQGKVILTFVVEKDGRLSDIKSLRSPNEALSNEAIRVMEASPKWIPGRQNNVAVRQQYTVPISFSLPGLTSEKNMSLSDSVMYVLNGKIVDKSAVKSLSPDKIATMNILKGKGAVEKYGEKAAKGVVEIITK
ncbi:energy transducer TonB [Mucilaginibacter sp. RS28]|uniref:Energy transducer TonB n=1 Tax=Mucilaginibacter straminoryzae TaxID=2932774 RepID=A0A9X1WZ57_9SPHI|nr:TonB family protein [Mucilaginibacter straminoryzae]MCJ8208209.1 energy transducer TonB [Mucilaginibacter straminoryzae]